MNKILTIWLAVSLIPICSFGDSFESWHIGLGNDDVIGIAMVSDTDGWALLMSFSMYHWNGQNWTRYEGPLAPADGKGGSPYGLEYYDPTHIYDYWVGLHIYDGTSWVEFEPQPPFGLADLEVINPDSIWGFGNYYDTCYWNGTEWIVYQDTPGFGAAYIYCLGFGSAEEGWAGGTMGAMSHFYDGAWQAYGPLTTSWLQHADFANNNYGMMGGVGGKLTYLDGTWIVHDTGSVYTEFFAIDDTHMVFTFDNGDMLIFYNDTYLKGNGTGGIPLYCVFATSLHSIWAGGENGYVCHWVWDGDGVQPSSVGQIKAQFPPVSGTSSNITPPKTKNDWNPLCPQMEFE